MGLAGRNDPIVYEDQNKQSVPDPNEEPIRDRRLFTQPYDLGVDALMSQVKNGVLFLKPLSDRPHFQRRYVWPNRFASKLIESILLNVPIPPVYLAQNEKYELDVIDGQQRLYSIYRFANNELKLSNLEVLSELNGKAYFEIPKSFQRKFFTHTVRCVIITNESDPEIRFDVFERLNTNTVPLNSQELRNCIYRGSLNALLINLAEYEPWLGILGRKNPDKRMRGEELILRFFAFQVLGLESYRTPQKHWLNEIAKIGRGFSDERIADLSRLWISTLSNCLEIFAPNECFRRLPLARRKTVINRALMDLTMTSLSGIGTEQALDISGDFRKRYEAVLQNPEFDDLITRAIDHKSRTQRRFEMWSEFVVQGLI